MVTATENIQKVETTSKHFRGRLSLKSTAKGEVQFDATIEFSGELEDANQLLQSAKNMLADTVNDLVETHGIKLAKDQEVSL
jgi:cell fate (sporulation/competence/biofilm development) regulator YmcA (YheA/YmcA/DUF963 family)